MLFERHWNTNTLITIVPLKIPNPINYIRAELRITTPAEHQSDPKPVKSSPSDRRSRKIHHRHATPVTPHHGATATLKYSSAPRKGCEVAAPPRSRLNEGLDDFT
ncbi:hypothetical protein J6590_059975 [Homalodisca vitripennis]|nr:hypothetical protein J6590_059975 [Homalodisca vitripennis]